MSTGAWFDDSTATEAPLFSAACDVATTPSVGRRRSSSAFDSEDFDPAQGMSFTTPPSFDAAAAAAMRLSDECRCYGGSRVASNSGSFDRLSQPTTSRVDAGFADDDDGWMPSQRQDALATGAGDYGGCGNWNDTNSPTASGHFRRGWNSLQFGSGHGVQHQSTDDDDGDIAVGPNDVSVEIGRSHSEHVDVVNGGELDWSPTTKCSGRRDKQFLTRPGCRSQQSGNDVTAGCGSRNPAAKSRLVRQASVCTENNAMDADAVA